MIGFRFKRFISFHTVPNISQIDKTVRTIAQLKADVLGRGFAEVYEIMPGRFQDQTWYRLKGTVKTQKPSVKLRHAYEKKKQETQETLYEQYGYEPIEIPGLGSHLGSPSPLNGGEALGGRSWIVESSPSGQRQVR